MINKNSGFKSLLFYGSLNPDEVAEEETTVAPEIPFVLMALLMSEEASEPELYPLLSTSWLTWIEPNRRKMNRRTLRQLASPVLNRAGSILQIALARLMKFLMTLPLAVAAVCPEVNPNPADITK